MSMITLKCPKCGGEAKFSLADTSYTGPRRCWKCHEYFTITIYNNQVTSCEPLSKEEYERQQTAKKAREKAHGGMDFSRQEQLEFPRDTRSDADSSEEEKIDIFNILAGKSKGGIDISSKQEQPVSLQSSHADAGPSRGDEADIFKHIGKKSGDSKEPPKQQQPVFPTNAPEKPREYIKPSSAKEPPKPADPQKPTIFPADPIRTFVPMEDIKEEPKKPKKDKPPPDRFNPFIPPQT